MTRETDASNRARILRVVPNEDWERAAMAAGPDLDAIGRKHSRFRYGAPLETDAAIPLTPEERTRLAALTAFVSDALEAGCKAKLADSLPRIVLVVTEPDGRTITRAPISLDEISLRSAGEP